MVWETGSSQQPEDPFGPAHRIGSDRDASHGDAGDVSVVEHELAALAHHVLELVSPAVGIRLGQLHLAGDPVEDQLEQLILVADVGIERGGPRCRAPRRRDTC